MTTKEKFLMFVYLGAIAEDMKADSRHATRLMSHARRIPEQKIPPVPANAAAVYLSYFYGERTRAFRWMTEQEPPATMTQEDCRKVAEAVRAAGKVSV